MRVNMKITHYNNEVFYREAGRSVSTKELNESAGIKYLLSNEIEHLRNCLFSELMESSKLEITKDYDGDYILSLSVGGITR